MLSGAKPSLIVSSNPLSGGKHAHGGLKKLFRGHRRTKIKVKTRGNQSSYNIDVKFCGWKGRCQVYKLSDGASQENGMYKVPFVLNMRSFLIKNFINLFIHKSIRPSDLSIAPSLFRSQFTF